MSLSGSSAALLVLSLPTQCASSVSDSGRTVTVTCVVCHCHLSITTVTTDTSVSSSLDNIDRSSVLQSPTDSSTISPLDISTEAHPISTLSPVLGRTLAGVCPDVLVSNLADRWLCTPCLRRLSDLAECESRAARLRTDLLTNSRADGEKGDVAVADVGGAEVGSYSPPNTANSNGDSSLVCYEITSNRLALSSSINNNTVLLSTTTKTTTTTTKPVVIATVANSNQSRSCSSPTEALSLVYLREQPSTATPTTTATAVGNPSIPAIGNISTISSAAVLRQMWRRVYDNGDNSGAQSSPLNNRRPTPMFECLVCGRHFVHRKSVSVHVRTHTGERPFSCEQCGGSFALRSTLVQHQLIHAGRRPFACGECGRAFVSRSNLRHHQRVHSRQKRACCDQCGKTFRDVQYMRTHMRVHTGERPYRCTVCDSRFTTLSNLYKHRRQRHATPVRPVDKAGDAGALCRPILQPFPVVSSISSARQHGVHHGDSAAAGGGEGGQCGGLSARAKTTARAAYTCDECGANFTRSETLRRHTRRFHQNTTDSVTSIPVVSTPLNPPILSTTGTETSRTCPQTLSLPVSRSLPQQEQQQTQRKWQTDTSASTSVLTSTSESDVDDLSSVTYCQLSDLLPLTAVVDTTPYLESVFDDLGSEGAVAPPVSVTVEAPLLVNDILSQSHSALSPYDHIVQ